MVGAGVAPAYTARGGLDRPPPACVRWADLVAVELMLRRLVRFGAATAVLNPVQGSVRIIVGS